MMDKTKAWAMQAILLAIDSIKDDIQNDRDEDRNAKRAEAILKLSEAYKTVKGS